MTIMPMLTTNLIKEELSFAYIMAVTAKNGFGFEIKRRDSDGVDLLITNKGKPTRDCIKNEGIIGVQMKSTVNWSLLNSEEISYNLDIDNYYQLIETELIVPRILILLCLPKDEKEWLKITSEELILKKCAYWHNLKGFPICENKTQIAVHIPESQLLTPEALFNLMVNIQKGENL